MPDFPRKLLGLLLIIAAVGAASWQALAVSCSASAAAKGSATQSIAAPR